MAIKKKQSLRNSEYYCMQSEFDELYSLSQKGRIFQNLMEIIRSDENIKLAYRNIKRNGGSFTPGVDGITIQDIEKLNHLHLFVLNLIQLDMLYIQHV